MDGPSAADGARSDARAPPKDPVPPGDGCQVDAASGSTSNTAGVETLNARTGRIPNLVALPTVPEGLFVSVHMLGVDKMAGRVVVQYSDGSAGSYVALLDAVTGRLRSPPPVPGGSVGRVAVEARSGRAVVVTTATDYEVEHGAWGRTM